MRVIFLGTPGFAVPIIEAINNSHHKIIMVITQPDKANSRGKKVMYSPLKTKAIDLNLPLAQYAKISLEGVSDIIELKPDIMVTAGYGQILSQELIDIPKYGIINVHGSLLPKYRGASPVQSALINGEETIGVTIMNTERSLDSGEIILQESIKLKGDENAAECLSLLSVIGARLVVKALDLIETGKATYTKQDAEDVTFCKLLDKKDGKLNFDEEANIIVNKVRGMTPSPSTFIPTKLGRLKVLKCEEYQDKKLDYNQYSNGEIVMSNPRDGLVIKCSYGFVKITYVQAENSKAMSTEEYLRGKGAKLLVGENISNE